MMPAIAPQQPRSTKDASPPVPEQNSAARARAREGVLFGFSACAKLRITGNDRLRFLNGQITNDARKATESSALKACVLSAKGRMNAYLSICAASNCFLVDADPELRESLQPRLERYIIADDVQIEDVSDRLSIFHVLNS